MNRLSLLVLGILLCSTASSGQTSPSDSQTLQVLLSEIHQLRLDLQTRIIAVQRGQILIYRLQGQEAIVARASQHLDEARDKLKKIQEERENVTTEIKQGEDFMSNTGNSQRQEFENKLARLKRRLLSLQNEEQQMQTREIEAEQQLREEEARVSDLRTRLDLLDKALESASPSK